VLRRIVASGALDDRDLMSLAVREQMELLEQARMLSELPPGGAEMVLGLMRRNYARATVRLDDGTIGYYERGTRTDDCFAPASRRAFRCRSTRCQSRS
jgi:hypothetical protein